MKPDRSGPGDLAADLRVDQGTFSLQLALSVAAGEVVGLLGPNGAGKTTVLRALAGLRRLDGGHVTLGDRVLDAPAARTWVAPEERSVGVVFPDLRLFPHLSARDNVAFGLRARGTPRRTADEVATDWLDRVGLAALADRRPRHLSGGQAQRVALARALAPGPDLLLLDEPLSALDVATRAEVRRDLRTHLAAFGGAAVVVTHDAVDALTLTDRLVVLDEGREGQQGPPAEVARRPRSRWVADLVGLTVLPGRHEGQGRIALDGGGSVQAAGGALPPSGESVYAAIRPGAVSVHLLRPDGSPRNVWEGTVAGVEAVADRVRIDVAGVVPLTAEITPAARAELALAPGDAVWVAVKATEVDVYPR